MSLVKKWFIEILQFGVSAEKGAFIKQGVTATMLSECYVLSFVMRHCSRGDNSIPSFGNEQDVKKLPFAVVMTTHKVFLTD